MTFWLVAYSSSNPSFAPFKVQPMREVLTANSWDELMDELSSLSSGLESLTSKVDSLINNWWVDIPDRAVIGFYHSGCPGDSRYYLEGNANDITYCVKGVQPSAATCTCAQNQTTRMSSISESFLYTSNGQTSYWFSDLSLGAIPTNGISIYGTQMYNLCQDTTNSYRCINVNTSCSSLASQTLYYKNNGVWKKAKLACTSYNSSFAVLSQDGSTVWPTSSSSACN